jgi:hypothetical protein
MNNDGKVGIGEIQYFALNVISNKDMMAIVVLKPYSFNSSDGNLSQIQITNKTIELTVDNLVKKCLFIFNGKDLIIDSTY